MKRYGLIVGISENASADRAAEIRGLLQERLPRHMVFVVLGASSVAFEWDEQITAADLQFEPEFMP